MTDRGSCGKSSATPSSRTPDRRAVDDLQLAGRQLPTSHPGADTLPLRHRTSHVSHHNHGGSAVQQSFVITKFFVILALAKQTADPRWPTSNDRATTEQK